ncbi:hypothetical protein K469DRAFT_715615 [Zopfia rhizophila CBS 207.26]|uniref:Uncharacterized protein n=1 Tax=Zopfia rhizophila CBS 207.26 TaxID=1314779 RepID=A0A6A6DQ13_9PEZI|nr:hypothetical protein K469DRAFT_715615 [Zopfia rhizophila CBS 207.26]
MLNRRHSVKPENIGNLGTRWLLDTDWVSTLFTRTHLSNVERLFSKHEYRTALAEVDSLLRCSLTREARFEGTLLKSTILRAIGSNFMYDALAQCSEALGLCDRYQVLDNFRPKANFYKGICLYRLKVFTQAQLAFGSVGLIDFFHEKTKE